MSDRYFTDIPKCHLRFATEEDVPVILNFIRRLAEYEKLLQEVEADEQLLRSNLFGEKSYAEIVLAELQQKPVGFALFFHNYSTFLGRPGIWLEDLFVLPDFRGRGIGKTLLTFLAALAVKRGCGRLEWSVLDWNTPAVDFYHSIGAKPMDEWTTFRLSGDTLKSAAVRFDQDLQSP